VDLTGFFERAADASDASVHHVGRRDDVHAGARLRERLLREDVERLVVQDVAVLVDHAVLAVRGVRIESDVGHEAELGESFLERGECARHQAFRIERLAAIGAFQLRIDHRKKREHRNAELQALLGHR